ncbi:MAG: MxcI [Labilithrix sp.]|nr:MxcI [Labilithrix sp.]
MTTRSIVVSLILSMALGTAACSEETSGPPSGSGPNDPQDPSNTPPGNQPSGSAPLYAIETLVFNDTSTTSYVVLLPNLDTQARVTLSSAREFPGYAQADAVGGQLVVSSGDAPRLTSYTIGDDLSWTEGKTISFADYTSASIDTSLYVATNKAYVPFDSTNWVTWDPTTFQVGRELGPTANLALTRGDANQLKIWKGYAHALRGTTLFQPYYWSTDDFHAYTQLSQVSVIDTASDAVKSLIDVPCPHLHIGSQDDQGNVYFSNGQGSIAAAVLDPNHARNCFARINAGQETLDAASVTYFKDLAEGREGSNFFYMGNDVGLFNVYHAERDNLGPSSTFDDVDYSANYHLWTLNLKTKAAAPMEGIDFAGGQFVPYKFGDRFFVTIPAPDYSSTTFYEIVNGRAEKRFDVDAWAFKVFRVR